MKKLFSKKSLSLLLVLAMVVALFAGMSFGASAATTITTEAQLKAMSLTGDYVLGSDIYISDVANWTPVGTSMSSANMFSGTFDGAGHTIYWGSQSQIAAGTQVTATGGSYWGVFGSSRGVIANVKVAGNLKLTGSSGSYVSPLVGYSSGSVYNCQSSVDFTAEDMDNVGGIVGALETTSTTALENPITIQYCGNTGDITASKRVGGVVGAVYCNVQGNAVVDRCYVKDCHIYTTNSGSKVWSGALAGYVKGGITNCYSDMVTLQASGGHYLSGLIGILNGSSPAAYATNCYANVESDDATVLAYTNCAPSYDRAFVGSVDGSSAVNLTNCYWTTCTEVEGGVTKYYFQPTSPNWGTWSGYGVIGTDITWANLSAALTTSSTPSDSYFILNPGDTHPTLKWESDSTFDFDVSTGTAGGASTTTSEYYVNQSYTGTTEVGTYAQPFKTLGAAVSAANSSTANAVTIKVVGTYTFAAASDAYSIYGNVSSSGTPITTVQSTVTTGTTGSFITVASGATVYLGGLRINGTGYANTIDNSGTLYVRNQAVVYGGTDAINVNAGGALTLNRSTIQAASASNYSVKLVTASGTTPAATCTMSVNTNNGQQLTISGKVYLGTGTYITMASRPYLMFPTANTLSITSVATASETVIAKGSGCTLDSTDANKLSVNSGVQLYVNENDNQIEIY